MKHDVMEPSALAREYLSRRRQPINMTRTMEPSTLARKYLGLDPVEQLTNKVQLLTDHFKRMEKEFGA